MLPTLVLLLLYYVFHFIWGLVGIFGSHTEHCEHQVITKITNPASLFLSTHINFLISSFYLFFILKAKR